MEEKGLKREKLEVKGRKFKIEIKVRSYKEENKLITLPKGKIGDFIAGQFRTKWALTKKGVS